MPENYVRFADLDFEDFKRLARDNSLSKYERIGFPNAYREGKEESIFQDICRKLNNLREESKTILDIGPGCSDLPFMMIAHCRAHKHHLILIDSQEMLEHLPDEPFVTKIPAHFPNGCAELLLKKRGAIDVILSYSVLHYVFAEGNLFSFLDSAVSLLADGGECLLGDIPNSSKRKRFFASRNGIAFHKQFMQTDQAPETEFNTLVPGAIDDSILLAMLLRCRNAGFDAYWLSQADELPMANRREDILITKP